MTAPADEAQIGRGESAAALPACTHELYEMETAIADGACPLCLLARVIELETALRHYADKDFPDGIVARAALHAKKT